MIDLIERGYELLAEGKVKRALACFGKAGERTPSGFLELAKCYRDGFGVEKDTFMAKKYFWLAVRRAKRAHKTNIRALRKRPRGRKSKGWQEMRRYAKVRESLVAA